MTKPTIFISYSHKDEGWKDRLVTHLGVLQSQGLLFPVIVKPCAWKTVGWLSRIQARPKDGRPLSAGDEHQIDADLAAIATEVHDLLKRRSGREE
jgi:hypothetical protein